MYKRQDQEKDAIREEEKEMPVGEVTVIKEKKGLFNLWENRKKKEKQERDNYTRSLQLTMTGYAVAEETAYEEEDMGRTVYMEERPAPRESTHRLLSEEGKLLATLEQPIYTIGKKRGETDLVLNDQSISRLHARIIKAVSYTHLDVYKRQNLWNRAQIIVVLVGLVIIFKEKITEVVNSIFTKITNQTKKI